MMSLKRIDAYKKAFNESNFKKKTMPKILSVLFAIIFWFYVMDQVNPEMVRTIPNLQIEVLNQENIESSGYLVLEEDVPNVTIKVKGRRKAVMDLKATDIILSADVKDFHKGINYFEIQKRIFKDNVSIEDVSVNRIQMTIDKLVESSRPITIKASGQLPAGESLGETKLNPEKVTVRGPESLVKQVASVVGTVDLGIVSNQAATTISLEPLDQNGKVVKGVTLSNASVLATFGLLMENTTKIEVDLTGTLPSGYKVTEIDVTPESLALKGSSDAIANLSSIKTLPIDLTGKTESQDIHIGLVKTNTSGVQGLPESVNVKLTIEKVEEKQLVFKASDIKWFNVPDGFNVDLPDPNRSITVKITAVTSVLEQLKNADLQLEVDAGELKEGLQKLKITASTSLMTETLTVVPATIDVEGVKQ